MSGLVLTDADAGTVHQTTVNQTVTLQLAENASTGLQWGVDLEPRKAGRITIYGTLGEHDRGPFGMRVIEILIKQPGTLTIDAKLWRSWEGEGSVAARKSFTLEVAP